MNTNARKHQETAKAKAASKRGSSSLSPKKPIKASGALRTAKRVAAAKSPKALAKTVSRSLAFPLKPKGPAVQRAASPSRTMKDSPKDARVGLRLRPEHKELFELAATLRGSNMTDFLVASAVEKAERIISDATATSLCLEAAKHFAEALRNPPEPNERMRAAAARYRELLSA